MRFSHPHRVRLVEPCVGWNNCAGSLPGVTRYFVSPDSYCIPMQDILFFLTFPSHSVYYVPHANTPTQNISGMSRKMND